MRLIVQLAIRCLIANYCTRWRPNFKGLSQDGDGQIFSKNLRASIFNDDLSNEPNFGRIHLARQYGTFKIWSFGTLKIISAIWPKRFLKLQVTIHISIYPTFLD